MGDQISGVYFTPPDELVLSICVHRYTWVTTKQPKHTELY